jgi:hypothetical protein
VTCAGDVLELFGIDPVEAPRVALGPTASALLQQTTTIGAWSPYSVAGLSYAVRQDGFRRATHSESSTMDVAAVEQAFAAIH